MEAVYIYCSHRACPGVSRAEGLISYLVSLVPICCLSSNLSSSVCLGRMFFSSSSRFEGLLLSLMAKESFLQTFMAREPVGGEISQLTEASIYLDAHEAKQGGLRSKRQEDRGKTLKSEFLVLLSLTLVTSHGVGHIGREGQPVTGSLPSEIPSMWQHHKEGQDLLAVRCQREKRSREDRGLSS